ncbi:MAG: FtsX-like permease family protein, partial [Archangium sp.]
LVIGAGLMLKSFWRLNQVEPGLEPQSVFVAKLALSPDKYREPARMAAFHAQLLGRLAARPEVASAGVGLSLPPGGDQRSTSYFVEGEPDWISSPEVLYIMSTPGFLETLRVPLRRGRWLETTDREGAERVVLVSESFARLHFQDKEPLGRRVAFSAEDGQPVWSTIVGVVGDVPYAGFETGAEPTVYVPLAQDPYPGGNLVVRAAPGFQAASLAEVVRAELRAVDADVPLAQPDTLEARLAAGLGQPRFRTLLLGAFGVLALVLAAVGIYGVMSYAVAQRTHEMGVRMALGAQRVDVLRLVMGQSLRKVGVGVAVGLAGAFAASRLLQGFLFGVEALDASVFLAVPVLLATIALVASWLPARRAANADPADVLRRG